MITINSIADLKAASTVELLEFFNHNADSEVKRFADRKTAERRVLKLIEENRGALPETDAPTTKPVSDEATELLELLKADADNWSGAPLWEGNVGSPDELPLLKELEAAGLVFLSDDKGEDGEPMIWVSFEGATAKRTNSQGIADSWTDPAVRAARSSRIHITVDGVEYGSVRKAFVALELPLKEHIPFRGQLRAAGTLDAYGMKWEVTEVTGPKS